MKRLAIETTNICNANCRFCAYRYMKRQKGILSNEKFEFFLKKYIEYGGGELKLTPIVGDPLVDRNLIDKIKMTKRTDKITHLYTYTNLIGLDNFDIREFLLSGIDKIDISTCFGGREMYKRLFGVDRYEDVMFNLMELIEENDRLGRKVKINIYERSEKPYPEREEVNRIIDCGYKIRKMENYDNWTGLIKLKDLPKGQEFRKIEDMSEPCSLFYKGLIILMNGDVGACWCRDVEAKLIVGNIYKNTLEEIWNGEVLKKIKQNWHNGHIPLICKNCYQYTPLSGDIRKCG